MQTPIGERAGQEPWLPGPELLDELRLPRQTPAVPIGSGQNNAAYELGGLILRVARNPAAERDLEREARIVDAVRPHLSTPVPAIRLCRTGGRLVSLHPRLPGQPLADLSGLTGAQRRILAADLAAFLKELHAMPAAHWPLGPATRQSAQWRALLQRCQAQVFSLIAADRAAELRWRFGAFIATCDALPCRVIHGDFGTGNILVDRGRLSGVIDFSGCGPGDPAYDLASLAAGFGDAFCARVMDLLPACPGMRERMEFYRSTFALLDILHGLEHRDPQALRAGLDGAARPAGAKARRSPC